MHLRKPKSTAAKIQPQRLFSDQKVSTDIDVTEMLKNIETQLPASLSKGQKLKLVRQIKRIWDQDPSKIQKLGEQMSSTLKQKQAEAKAAKKNHEFGITDFLKEIMKLLVSAKVGPLLMVASAAAQAMNNVVINTGQPQGGLDLCNQVLFNVGCAQGYITNGTNPWTPTDPQFNRIVSPVNGIAPDVTSPVYLQLRDCLTTEMVGSSAAQTYATTSAAASITSCSTTSTAWNNYQVQATVRGSMTAEKCLLWQNDMQTKFQSCQSLGGAALKAGAIAGIVIGSVAAVALCVVAYIYCKDQSCNINPPCLQRV